MSRPIAFTIAGSDPSGGAGIQQDIRVFTCLGVFACSAITAITVQNTLGVKKVLPVEAALLQEQVETVLEDFLPGAIKLGMLATRQNVETIVEILCKIPQIPVVADPVMLSKNGKHLLREDAIEPYLKKLLPLVDVLTPNLNEAEAMSRIQIQTKDDMIEAGRIILSFMEKGRLSPHSPIVMIKGGHFHTDNNNSKDAVISSQHILWLSAPRNSNRHTHGTGCTLSSAICGHISRGEGFMYAIERSKEFISKAIEAGFRLGRGIGPVDPMFFL